MDGALRRALRGLAREPLDPAARAAGLQAARRAGDAAAVRALAEAHLAEGRLELEALEACLGAAAQAGRLRRGAPPRWSGLALDPRPRCHRRRETWATVAILSGDSAAAGTLLARVAGGLALPCTGVRVGGGWAGEARLALAAPWEVAPGLALDGLRFLALPGTPAAAKARGAALGLAGATLLIDAGAGDRAAGLSLLRELGRAQGRDPGGFPWAWLVLPGQAPSAAPAASTSLTLGGEGEVAEVVALAAVLLRDGAACLLRPRRARGAPPRS